MRNLDKILIVLFPHSNLLLPEQVSADAESTHSFLDQQVDDGLAGGMKIVIYLPIAVVSNALHLPCNMVPLRFGQAQLQFLHAFVVPLIDGLEPATVNQSRDEPGTVCSYRR